MNIETSINGMDDEIAVYRRAVLSCIVRELVRKSFQNTLLIAVYQLLQKIQTKKAL